MYPLNRAEHVKLHHALRYAGLLLLAIMLSACSKNTPLAERPLPAQNPPQERRLPFDGAHNFRDLGGYQSADGKTVRWGLIYRSDKLSDISSADEAYLEALEIRRIVDFRSESERLDAPNRVAPDSSIRIVNKPIAIRAAAVDQMIETITSSTTTAADMQQFLVNANREMVEKYTPVYREYLQELLVESSYPTVFHCTAGKDRTGFAAALVLSALGVPRETIVQDYLASNDYNREYIDKMVLYIKLGSLFRANDEAVRALFGVQERYLNEAFAAIDEHYGSMDNYLQQGLGIGPVERQQLRDILLY
ncbi:tyrosine-protein phosphatase [Litorivivens sp.]|uniref:tyrosine-protein phosphatase n=1 Tax=Litorivivens sp. TaxID=2020868 RepID=UPI003565DAD7